MDKFSEEIIVIAIYVILFMPLYALYSWTLNKLHEARGEILHERYYLSDSFFNSIFFLIVGIGAFSLLIQAFF